MTGLEAWSVISKNLTTLYKIRAMAGSSSYVQEEIDAEVVCFMALRKYDEMMSETKGELHGKVGCNG